VLPNANGKIGVKPVMARRPMGLGSSLVRAAIEPARVVHLQVLTFARIFTGADTPQFGAAARSPGRSTRRTIGPRPTQFT